MCVSVEHSRHQWHIKTITDSVWRKDPPGQHSAPLFVHLNQARCLLKRAQLTSPCPWHELWVSLGGKWAHSPGFRMLLLHIPGHQPLARPNHRHLTTFFDMSRGVQRLLCGDPFLGESQEIKRSCCPSHQPQQSDLSNKLLLAAVPQSACWAECCALLPPPCPSSPHCCVSSQTP